jgi:ATP-dependent Clp protease adaptor protein ClpS
VPTSRQPSKQPSQGGTSTVVERRTKLRAPPPYRVLLHDDDFTTMDFVVEVLETIFGHGRDAATRIMLDVHQKGIGLAGVYPHEIAEAKASEVMRWARAEQFPFLATIEPADK